MRVVHQQLKHPSLTVGPALDDDGQVAGRPSPCKGIRAIAVTDGQVGPGYQARPGGRGWGNRGVLRLGPHTQKRNRDIKRVDCFPRAAHSLQQAGSHKNHLVGNKWDRHNEGWSERGYNGSDRDASSDY